MAENSTDDNSTAQADLVDMDDLDAFSKAFYGVEDTEEAEAKPEDRETEDDSLAPSEDTDAEDEPESPSEDDESEPEAPEEEPRRKNRKSAKERIEELVAKERSVERELVAEREQRIRLEERLKALEAPKPVEQPQAVAAEDSAPNPNALDDKGEPLYPLGEFDPLFVRDLTKFTIAQETKAFEERQQKAQEAARLQTEQAELRQKWEAKVAEVKEELPDYQEQVAKLGVAFGSIEPQYGEYLANTIMQCDNGPEIMYYLSQNIGEAQKIVASGPFAATLAIGKLQAKLEPVAERNTQKIVSEAPPPPAQRVRGSGGQFSVRPDTDDLDAFSKEFFKHR